jgi:hypothetical protein
VESRSHRRHVDTEGLEPAVTEELVKLMLAAKGGRIARTP